MKLSSSRVGRWRLVQWAVVLLGFTMVVLGLSGGRITGGSTYGFGRAQAMFTLVGLLMLAAGLLGRRTPGAYRATAIVALNTVLLLVLAEFAAVILLAFMGLMRDASGDVPRHTELAYYSTRDWGERHWREYAAVSDATPYRPYVIWRSQPYGGQTINVSSLGNRRVTPGADCRTGSYRVFTFGGSGMWGVGSPDWGTIPAYLQDALARQRAGPVCVANFADRGYVSTQGVIQLIRELQHGNVPDLVIFYDSVNDITTAGVYGEAGTHMWMDRVAERLEGPPVGAGWLRESALFRLVGSIVPRPDAHHDPQRVLYDGGVEADTLAASISRVYLNNFRTVGALAREYGFGYEFFWQPHILVTEKPFTDEERAIYELDARQTHRWILLKAFAQVEQAAAEHQHLTYLGEVFNDEAAFVYIDSHHVTPEANRMIAGRMLAVIDGVVYRQPVR